MDADELREYLQLKQLKPGEKTKVIVIGAGSGDVDTVFHMLSEDERALIIIDDYKDHGLHRPSVPNVMENIMIIKNYHKEFDSISLRDDNNEHHGPSKHRKGTNKKYVKRKKARNGRQKRKK